MAEPWRTRLARLDPAGHLLPPEDRRLVLLTGQSDFATSALPPDKIGFLEAVAPPGTPILPAGFPWHTDFAESSAGPVPLLAASLANARQWIWARRDPAFVASLAAVVGRLLAATRRDLFLVTGSCGVDLLAAATTRLPPGGPAVHLAALGPAGRMPAPERVARRLVLQGRRDGWSRLLWRGPVDGRPPCGHLDYWADPEARASVARFFREGLRP